MVTKYGSALIVGTYHIGPEEPEEPEDAEKVSSDIDNFTVKDNELTDEEMIKRLRAKGYLVLDKNQAEVITLKCTAYNYIRARIMEAEDGIKA